MLNVVYSDSMVLSRSEAPGPGASKAAAVTRRALLHLPVKLLAPKTPLPPEILALAHDPEYVRGVAEGAVKNGFGTNSRAVYDQAVACSTAMTEAAILAVKERTIVCVPASGFHHAGYANGWGFCTFNGLMLATLVARAALGPLKVLIIDGDAHTGDGTNDIIETLGIRDVRNLTGPDLHEPSHYGFAAILDALRSEAWDLVLYQAGADAHEDDPFGAGYLSDTEWDDRDRLVFKFCAGHKIPVVFTFAGGYAGAATEELHYRTMRSAAQQLAIHRAGSVSV